MNNINRPVVAIAGASGQIGQHLLNKITKTANVIALSRSAHNQTDTEHVVWRSCDFFSPRDAEQGLEGADFAVYMIHSLTSSATLTQAAFSDTEVLLADNFARAAKRNGIKQIIYMRAAVPKHELERTFHLKSRLEVEKILHSYGIPVRTVRTGLIIGTKILSLPAPSKLIERLPSWTRTLKEVLKLPWDNHYWNSHLQDLDLPRASKSTPAFPPNVRSVQRVLLPKGRDADWAGKHYFHWLAGLANPLITIEADVQRNYSIFLGLMKGPILEIRFIPDYSYRTRALYFISGGTLARITNDRHCRLEFRQIPGSQECIIAIHDYQPALPWYLYKYTQADIHLLVMYLYKKHLYRLMNDKQKCLLARN
ncbi:NAD(P)H-binding protein [Sediminibacillus albus]|uniref:NAD(P)H-binding n=1 Tax=Sediminibacillus albus TaxID=407036 RepID=A0A1G8WYF3_9BACI|nr:NAD(P)H-binding protein [Sediminibacillus albus]SDJ83106.1 NAD(P)H-binding [Sediminibacillus albus]